MLLAGEGEDVDEHVEGKAKESEVAGGWDGGRKIRDGRKGRTEKKRRESRNEVKRDRKEVKREEVSEKKR